MRQTLLGADHCACIADVQDATPEMAAILNPQHGFVPYHAMMKNVSAPSLPLHTRCHQRTVRASRCR
jgi:hypothetical protein